MWRLAHIVPLHKGTENKSCASSYRPISLTDASSKLLECIVDNQNENILISKQLNLYRPAWLHFTPIDSYKLVTYNTKIANVLNNYNARNVFLIDFARAFDKVPHSVSFKRSS